MAVIFCLDFKSWQVIGWREVSIFKLAFLVDTKMDTCKSSHLITAIWCEPIANQLA